MHTLIQNLFKVLSIVVIIFACVQYKSTLDILWLILAMSGFILFMISTIYHALLLYIAMQVETTENINTYLTFFKTVICEMNKFESIKKEKKKEQD